MIRGEKPVIDKKYDILKHPNVKYTTDGQAKPYEHGKTERATASILQYDLDKVDISKIKNITEVKTKGKFTGNLLSEEDIENYYLREEYENEKQNEQKKQK